MSRVFIAVTNAVTEGQISRDFAAKVSLEVVRDPYLDDMRRLILLALAVASACVLFEFIDLPTPMLFGGLAGALGYALARPADRIELPAPAFKAGQATVGVIVGASIDWASLGHLGARWVVVAFVSCFSLVISVVMGRLLVRRGVTPVTAAFSSIAGGAAGLTAMADDLGADSRVVAVLQYLRLLVVLVTMPVVVSIGFGATNAAGAFELAERAWPRDLAYVAIAMVVGLWVGKRVNMPSPAILGPLLIAALLVLIPGFQDAGVPEPVQAIGYLIIGVQVGLKFTVASLRSISTLIPTALVTIVVTLVACAGLGWVLTVTTGAEPLDAYLATTPGGIYAVMGTSAATGGDVTFVAATQVLRLLIVLASAPLLSTYLHRLAAQTDTSDADSVS